MKRAIFTTMLVVCAALPALSAELEFSASGDVEYDDNIYRERDRKKDDVLFRLRPAVRIYEDRGDDLNYSFGYEAPIELSLDGGSDYDEVDHLGNGSVRYHVNDRFELFASDHYGYIRSTLRRHDEVTDTLGFSGINDRRDRIEINDAVLGGSYSFSPRTVARLIATSSYFDSSRDDRAEVYSLGATADAQYRLTLKHQVGAGAGYSFQDFGDRQDISGSQTDTYRMFGSWRWSISPTLAFDLEAGPAYLQTDQESASAVRTTSLVAFRHNDAGQLFVANFASCGVINGITVESECVYNIPATGVNLSQAQVVTNLNPGGEDDDQVTGFVEAVLAQRWTPVLATALRYTRHQGDGSGLGGTVIVDAVSLSNDWDFAERWHLNFRGDFVRRESAFDLNQTYDVVRAAGLGDGVPAGLAVRTGSAFNSKRNYNIDTDSWSVAARITHDLFKTTSLYAQVRYHEQDSRGDSLGSSSDFENFLATFGVRHVFEPIPLW
jgi:predicted porin